MDITLLETKKHKTVGEIKSAQWTNPIAKGTVLICNHTSYTVQTILMVTPQQMLVEVEQTLKK